MRIVTLNKTLPMRVLMLDTDQNAIQTTEYRLTYSMTTKLNPEAVDPHLEASKAQNKSYAKVNMFVEQVLDHSFLAEISNPDVNLLEKYNNNIIIVPDLSETTFLAALHCKLNSIVDTNTLVDKITLADTDQQLTYTYEIQEMEDDSWIELPGHEEWLPANSFWDTSWWFRYDVSTYDGMAKDSDDLDAWRQTMQDNGGDEINKEALDYIDTTFDKMFDETVEGAGEIIDLEEFKVSKTNKKKGWTPKLV
ncbi:hypothetical protein N9I83_00805 [bacterium]|nr:hypothetical protein [bacterium]